jgi:phosphatidylinositol 4-kinase A
MWMGMHRPISFLDGIASTHPLAREARFSFLLFAFETLKSSHLDSFCETTLRDSLYSAAYSWFAVRPQ